MIAGSAGTGPRSFAMEPIGTMASNPSQIAAQMPAEWRDFFALTKPRVMTLVIFTAICGVLAAPGTIHPVIGFTAILCIALGAGGSGALNQWWEADLDAKMKRTASRPLPAGRMDRTAARDGANRLFEFSARGHQLAHRRVLRQL